MRILLTTIILTCVGLQGSIAQPVACSGGTASGYPCSNMDLMSFRNLNWVSPNGNDMNDIWGWTDPQDLREYALVGTTGEMMVIDITNASNPEKVFRVPTNTGNNTWRDIKVYRDHAFIVADINGAHGMQVVDLTNVRTADRSVVPNIAPIAIYTGGGGAPTFGSTHNIVINEDSGFAYGVGGSTCNGGLHMIDISTPSSPTFAGCFSADDYTHDAQCVNYNGPDPDYQGREICFNSNEDTITIVDVTNKSAPVQISRTGYAGEEYTHQAWLTDDHKYLLANDELDERRLGINTTTFIWDLTDLDNPPAPTAFVHSTTSTDHNLYIQKDYVFLANYRSGLRMMKLDRANLFNGASAANELTPIGFFDSIPGSDAEGFRGAWSSYPYFCRGNIPFTSIEEGLFIVRPQDQGFVADGCQALGVELDYFEAIVDGDFIDISWSTLSEKDNAGFEIEFAEGSSDFEVVAYIDGQINSDERTDYNYRLPIEGPGTYHIRVKDIDNSGTFNYWPVQTLTAEIPGDHIVFSAYPNPFSGETTVRFATTENQWVKVGLFNSLGQQVMSNFEGLTEAGSTKVLNISAEDLPNGVYFLIVEGNTFRDSRSLTVNK